MPFFEHLISITMHILHSGSARFVVEHIKHFAEILWRTSRSSITHQEEHHTIRVVLGLNILVHPDLAQHVDGLHTESLSDAMCETGSTGNVANTHDLTNMGDIVPGFKRLHLTWAFTAPGHVRASIHPVKSWFPVHGSVHPFPCLCGADNGGSSTARVWAAEVETTACFRCGR
ncbi:AC5 protein [Tomato leaf curl Palampur virus]|uniref:AC5 protein n=1 Tax=Tomato leaf curl Palampur virus TaxID=526476 RepID=A0A168TEA0_9GEMI|nr:AC5 protein [Tomato leaf curl Palampur virus]SAM29875.1 AC5 protein [Tomato leaf curl Palampur virus]SAM29906.1 AC5 protein [Tomato leaf curl Palampur virus]